MTSRRSIKFSAPAAYSSGSAFQSSNLIGWVRVNLGCCWTVCGIGKVQSIFISGQLKVILLFRYSIILSFHIPCFTISHLCTIYRAGGCLAVCSTNYQPCHYHTTKYCVPNYLTCNVATHLVRVVTVLELELSFIKGVHICMKTFLFLHSVSRFRLNNLQIHYDKYGVTPRLHGPIHIATMEDTRRAVAFITNMAAVHALPLPGRNRTNKDERYLLLPSDMTKAFVYRKYNDACTQDSVVPFQRRKFETVWNEILPYIVTARPASDLCFVCHQNNKLLMRSVNMPDNIKSVRLQQAQQHLDRAHKERAFYNSQCKAGATSNPQHSDSACSPTTMHYSDYTTTNWSRIL